VVDLQAWPLLLLLVVLVLVLVLVDDSTTGARGSWATLFRARSKPA